VVALLALLLLLQYVVPYFIERYQYAATRGRQQAEYELANEGLKDLQLAGLSQAYQMVSNQVGPSVVHIDVRSVHALQDTDELAQLYGPDLHESRGQGSGVIVDESGYIVTNYHVVHNASEIQATLGDGRILPARIVGSDALTDIAVLKIAGGGFVAAEWGDSDNMQVGALVWAVGSPFGLQSTVTSGIISAKHRAGMAGEVYQDFLQTDAAVNPGNSGGPLVDVTGRVIGINTAIYGDSYRGVSFAIPSRVAQEVYERLKAEGRVSRGWLGVQLSDVSEETARKYELPDTRGAVILWVIDDPGIPSPASDAGIRVGDIVTAWNGAEINKSADLIRLVAKTEVGSTVTADILRRGKPMQVQVTVAERPTLD
jgi:S1-C subfamily serine protease